MAAQEILKPSQQVRQPMPSASALSVVVFFNSMLLLLCSIVCAFPSLMSLVFVISQPSLYPVEHTQILGARCISAPLSLNWSTQFDCEFQSQRHHLSGHTVSIIFVSEKPLAQVNDPECQCLFLRVLISHENRSWRMMVGSDSQTHAITSDIQLSLTSCRHVKGSGPQ